MQQNTDTDSPTLEKEVVEANTPVALQPDNENFPKLPSSLRKTDSTEPQQDQQQQVNTTPVAAQFVWTKKPKATESPSQMQHKEGGDKGKGKQVSKHTDSAPITRQGYRSSRLADDFWVALNPPLTPTSQKKTIRVIPILIKEGKDGTTDYLVNLKTAAPRSIAQVHIAELLAGVSWTEARVRQHVVNEVAQTLYKVLVFTNPSSNPLQRWKQGKWFACWEGELDRENKIKPKRGHTCGWFRVPLEIRDRIQLHLAKGLEAITED